MGHLARYVVAPVRTVVGCCVVGAVLASATVAPSQASRSSSAVGSRVPLVVCPTSFGLAPGKPAALPAATFLAVVTPLSGSLAAYTDRQGYMTVAGPRGWRCSASYGADGSGGVRVFPGGRASLQEGIVGAETSACFGCTSAQACALFPLAARAYRSAYPGPCPARRPARETISRLSPTVVAFEDPAHVQGEGALSGGPFPANGVMTYAPGNESGRWLETCTLPADAHSTCTAVLNDFVARYGNR